MHTPSGPDASKDDGPVEGSIQLPVYNAHKKSLHTSLNLHCIGVRIGRAESQSTCSERCPNWCYPPAIANGRPTSRKSIRCTGPVTDLANPSD